MSLLITFLSIFFMDLSSNKTSSNPVVISSISNATSLDFFSFFFCFFLALFFCARVSAAGSCTVDGVSSVNCQSNNLSSGNTGRNLLLGRAKDRVGHYIYRRLEGVRFLTHLLVLEVPLWPPSVCLCSGTLESRPAEYNPPSRVALSSTFRRVVGRPECKRCRLGRTLCSRVPYQLHSRQPCFLFLEKPRHKRVKICLRKCVRILSYTNKRWPQARGRRLAPAEEAPRSKRSLRRRSN